MVSNLLADTYETCFDTSRPQERPQRIAGGFDREGTAPFDVRVLRRIGNTVRARLQQIDERAVQLRADTERAMGDYLKHHSTEGDTVMASVEDYPYFLDELKNLNMLVTRAATDEEYANSVEKLYMSFQQLNRAFNTDEENVREQLDRINGMLKGQQFGPRGGRLSLHVDFHPIDRQFKSSLGRIMSKLDDWTRNARSNPMETRKAFAGCETFIGRLQAELGQIRDTNGIKEYGARNLDPRVRSSFYAIVHHNDLPDERISSTGGKSGGALQELTSFVYGAALIYLLGGDLTGKPTYTTLFLDEALNQSRRTLHETRPDRAAAPRLPDHRIRAGKQNRRDPQHRRQSVRGIQGSATGNSYLQELDREPATQAETQDATVEQTQPATEA